MTDGFDSYVHDAPLLFQGLGVASVEELEGWAALVLDELSLLERMRDLAGPIPLGFAHGLAGLLFRALCLMDVHPSLSRERLVVLLDWLAEQRVDVGRGSVWPMTTGTAPRDDWSTHSLCNGSTGHGVLFLEAAARLDEPRYLELFQRALHATADESRTNLGFCCGQAGRCALVSRALRVGVQPEDPEAVGCLERLMERVQTELDQQSLRPLSGLPSCLPALCARGPDDAILDVLLPPPTLP